MSVSMPCFSCALASAVGADIFTCVSPRGTGHCSVRARGNLASQISADANIRALKLGPFQIGVLELSPFKIRALKPGVTQIGALKLRPSQIGALKLGVTQIGALKLGVTQIGALKRGRTQMRALKLRLFQDRALKLGVVELALCRSPPHLRGPEIGPGQIGAAKVRPVEQRVAKIALAEHEFGVVVGAEIDVFHDQHAIGQQPTPPPSFIAVVGEAVIDQTPHDGVQQLRLILGTDPRGCRRDKPETPVDPFVWHRGDQPAEADDDRQQQKDHEQPAGPKPPRLPPAAQL